MAWLPDHIWLAQKAKGKGKGKGWGGGWVPRWGKGKSKGKGKGKGKGMNLSKFAPECKVWVGGISETTSWKELEEHMNSAGKTKWVEVFKGKSKGTACVAYATADEATSAISALNGSSLGDGTLEVDTWNKKEKE
mmetsp:Transcript_45294/g.71642  ORF Transcript_45294/g.71642 Transcript_45294/m.71642 type:complete len:135 (-) Transcript_45294:70-474(-)|eukprot:CAMPEP_0169124880 /NCGR_PEP_ID=MMETSP1015-20121227/34571_1 /TAXON_ID=342587 /ORGANISM="Karlodinium micrum, Strain CCMP2283" /LENGTH=134 /DNA_ID=CAMNT_0009188347 /DNA_START=67 /DNA_END=471 /DNA_ORIENTATION=+